MHLARLLIVLLPLAGAGCALQPFESPPHAGTLDDTAGNHPAGRGPVIGSSPEVTPTPQAGGAEIVAPPPTQLPRERPRTAPATLSPASRSLVSQAQAQRKKGDLPGATASLERALRIEPSNPLLWIEMGRLRMDQRNFPQAESMGRKALAISVGDDHTQAAAWTLIADSLKARGRNPQAQEALEKARELAQY
jgi:Flp pilus assembly protein TadD